MTCNKYLYKPNAKNCFKLKSLLISFSKKIISIYREYFRSKQIETKLYFFGKNEGT
jgi:hypothetical protein